MATPSALKPQLDRVIQEMTQLYGTFLTQAPTFTADISSLQTEKDNADRKYVEEISRREALGGRTRMQTLQEFVILFFFVSYALLVVSFAVRAATLEGRPAAIKILGLGLFALLFISAFVIRFA